MIRLRAALDELHGRGVALADLHHRDVLLGPDETLYQIAAPDQDSGEEGR